MKKIVLVSIQFRGRWYSRLAWARVEGKRTVVDHAVYERLIADAGAQGHCVRLA